MKRRRKSGDVIILLLSSLIALAWVTGTLVRPEDRAWEKTQPLIRAEHSVDTGWLRHYDYNQHQDLGQIMEAYWEAYQALSPEQLVRKKLLAKGSSPRELLEAWQKTPLKPEPEPFAIDLVAHAGKVEAITFTRVKYDHKIDVYVLTVKRERGKWVLHTKGISRGVEY